MTNCYCPVFRGLLRVFVAILILSFSWADFSVSEDLNLPYQAKQRQVQTGSSSHSRSEWRRTPLGFISQSA